MYVYVFSPDFCEARLKRLLSRDKVMATAGRRGSKPRRMEGSCRAGRGEGRGKKRGKKNRQSRESLALANALITR